MFRLPQRRSFLLPKSPLSTAAPSSLPTELPFVQSVQKWLAIAEQVMPLVEKYGPMIKQAPALWRVMKALRQSDSSPSPEETPASKPTKPTPKIFF